MTIDEAKQVFLSRGFVEVEGGTIYDADKWREACVVISEWLEQEPCEDTISRQAVMDCFKKWQPYMATRLWDFEKELSALPSVKPQEPKTVLYSGDGYADGYMVYDMAECPNCGYEYEDGDKDWGLSFCPNCGQELNWESEE